MLMTLSLLRSDCWHLLLRFTPRWKTEVLCRRRCCVPWKSLWTDFLHSEWLRALVILVPFWPWCPIPTTWVRPSPSLPCPQQVWAVTGWQLSSSTSCHPLAFLGFYKISLIIFSLTCNYGQKNDTAQPAPGPAGDQCAGGWPEVIYLGCYAALLRGLAEFQHQTLCYPLHYVVA